MEKNLILDLYDAMRSAYNEINEPEKKSGFRLCAEISAAGTFHAYLWTDDYKVTVLSKSETLDTTERAYRALSIVAHVVGYVKGYAAAKKAAEEAARLAELREREEVEFDPDAEAAKKEPVAVEA